MQIGQTQIGHMQAGRNLQSLHPLFGRIMFPVKISLETQFGWILPMNPFPCQMREWGLVLKSAVPWQNSDAKRPGMHSHAKRGNEADEAVSDWPKSNPSPANGTNRKTLLVAKAVHLIAFGTNPGDVVAGEGANVLLHAVHADLEAAAALPAERQDFSASRALVGTIFRTALPISAFAGRFFH